MTMRRHSVLIGVVLLMGQMGSQAVASDISTIFKEVKGAVAVILTVQREFDPGSVDGFVNREGLGSGVLISDDGKVVTAAHVVHTADKVEAVFPSGQRIQGRVLGSAPWADIALIQLDRAPKAVNPVTFGNSDKMSVGEEIFIVGAPLGISHTLTVGHLSGRRKANTLHGDIDGSSGEFFQTDAAIYQGNSGGPMFNMKGEVIGIVSHMISKTGGYDGLGFAVTSNVAQRLLFDEQSIWSGMQGFPLGGELAKAFNLPQPVGLLVQRVAAQSLSGRAGLRGGSIPATIQDQRVLLGGDIILRVQGIPISKATMKKIKESINRARLGDTITLTVLREGKILDLTAMRLRTP